MEYENIREGRFIERINRFVARVEVCGTEVRAHVKNTGRCRELLVSGATVYLEDFAGRMGSRKLRYSLIGVRKGTLLINMDSQAPNQAVKEAFEDGALLLPDFGQAVKIQPEKTYGESRLDFYIENQNGEKGFVEVKGVTLEAGGIAAFPDAPTERGIKHIQELARAKEEGYYVCALFVIQMKGVRCFYPNDRTHPQFGDALREAEKKGVRILACDCQVTETSMKLDSWIPVDLCPQSKFIPDENKGA